MFPEPEKVSPPGEIAALPAADEAGAHRREPPAPEHRARYGWAAPLVAGGSVLDAGCGTGAGTALLAASAVRAVGVDASPPLVAAATRRGVDAGFHVGDLCRRLPFPDGEFDAVVCFETIEQLADPARAMEEMRRVLRAGGLLLISCCNPRAYPPGNPLHLHDELTTEWLRATLARHFSNVAIQRQHSYEATLIAADATLAADDPRRPLTADVGKVVRTAPDDALYAIAMASDGELPAARPHVALGSTAERDEQRRLTKAWQERAIRAETELAAMRTEIEFSRWHQGATAPRGRDRPPS